MMFHLAIFNIATSDELICYPYEDIDIGEKEDFRLLSYLRP